MDQARVVDVMTHSRRKGSKYELDVHKYLSKHLGDRWHRTNRNGFDGDDGDIDGRISVECKNHKTMNLAGWLAQAWEQCDGMLPVVIHKRKGKSQVAEHYVTMDVATFVQLLKETHHETA